MLLQKLYFSGTPEIKINVTKLIPSLVKSFIYQLLVVLYYLFIFILIFTFKFQQSFGGSTRF